MTSSKAIHSILRRLGLTRHVRFFIVMALTVIFGGTTIIQQNTGFRVSDGDSFKIDGQRMRLWGIDAPELKQTCKSGAVEYKCGEKARDALAALLADRILSCTPVDADKYGGDVVKCDADGIDVGGAMVSAGWALDYPEYSFGVYKAKEIQAHAKGAGIWRSEFEKPWEYRKTHRR